MSDIDKELAKEFRKGARQAGKESVKNNGGNGAGTIPIPGHVAPQNVSILDQIAAEAQACRVNIQRMDRMTGAWEFIPSPGPINPRMLVDPGIESLVMQYAGGGDYRVTIRTPGYQDIEKSFKIAGQPKDPSSTNQPGSSQQAGFGNMPSVNPFGGAGWGMGMGMGPWSPPFPQQQQKQGPSSTDKLMEHMITMMMLEKQGLGGKKGEDDEVKLLREQMQQQREEFRRQQEASERKLEELQRRKEMEAMQAASDKRFSEMVAMIKDGQRPQPTIADQLAPILPLLTPKNDGMAEVWKAMAESQASSSQTMIELMKAQNERPGWDERLANVMGSMASMSTQMMQMQLQAQGGGSPWLDLLSQTIGEISDVFKTLFAAGGGEGEGDSASPQIAQAQSGWGQPPAELPAPQNEQQLEQHAAAWGVPIESEQQAQHASIIPPPPESNYPAAQVVDPQPPVPQSGGEVEDAQYDLDADPAFKAIMDKIQSSDPVEEVAVRLYKHGQGQSGHPIAKAWFEQPREVGDEILHQIGVPAERRGAVAAGLEKLQDYIGKGGDPNSFSRYKPARRPRRRVPTIEGPGGEFTAQYFDPEPVAPPVAPVVMEPTEPAATTVDVPPEPPVENSEAGHAEPAQG